MVINVIGSTLPFHFLLKSQTRDNNYYIFRNNKLKKTFESLTQKGNHKKYYSFEKDFELVKKLVSSDNKLVCFHECCFSEIDKLIIKYNKKVYLYPVSHLSTFIKIESKIPKEKLNYFPGFLKFKLKIKLFLFKILYNSKYHFYLAPTDYGSKDDFIIIKSLNTQNNRIVLNKKLHGFKYHKYKLDRNSKTVIILISSDVIKSEVQIAVYKKIYKQLKAKTFEVLIKGHPSLNCKLLYDNFDENDIIEANYPFDVLNIRYRFKVSLFSTSLIFEPKKSISIQNLIPKPLTKRECFKFKLRKHHLKFVNKEIVSPRNFKEMINYITND